MDLRRDVQIKHSTDRSFWGLLALLILASLVAISNQSLWIDEAVTAWQAGLPSLKECWQQQIADHGSELQMPLFMVYLWSWEQFFDANEWSLRFSNLPWLILGFAAWLKASSHNKNLRLGVALATAFSPFVWFYLNEARPYTMQLGGSFLMLAALYRLGSAAPSSKVSQRLWSIALAVGIFIVCASSMLGVLWVFAALSGVAMAFGVKRTANLLKLFSTIWLLTFVALVLLGIYFLWTFQQGARASGAAGTDFKNLFFVGYEFLGFSGLGPGRLQMREAGLKSLRPYVPILVIYGLVLSALLLIAWRERSKISAARNLIWPAVFFIVATAILLMMGHVAHFRVLGRHFTPLVVIVLVWLGFGLSQFIFRPGTFPKSIAALFIGLNIFSCLSLRFADRHEKDDYRAAAKIAKTELAEGKTVWWNADKAGASFYRVPISEEPLPEKVWLLRNPETHSLLRQFPDLVITSKPDVYDAQNTLGKFLEIENYRPRTNLPAFKIWEKPRE